MPTFEKSRRYAVEILGFEPEDCEEAIGRIFRCLGTTIADLRQKINANARIVRHRCIPRIFRHDYLTR